MYRHYSNPLVYHGIRCPSPLRQPQALSFAAVSAITSAVHRKKGTTQNTISTSLLSLLIKSWNSPASNRCRTRDSPMLFHIRAGIGYTPGAAAFAARNEEVFAALPLCRVEGRMGFEPITFRCASGCTSACTSCPYCPVKYRALSYNSSRTQSRSSMSISCSGLKS